MFFSWTIGSRVLQYSNKIHDLIYLKFVSYLYFFTVTTSMLGDFNINKNGLLLIKNGPQQVFMIINNIYIISSCMHAAMV